MNLCMPSTIDLAGGGDRARRRRCPGRTGSGQALLQPVVATSTSSSSIAHPSLGLLTVNGLAAAGESLMPIQCEYYALEGLGQLLRTSSSSGEPQPSARSSTILLTMYDGRTKLPTRSRTRCRKHFGDKVCTNGDPADRSAVSEAPSFGKPVTVHDPHLDRRCRLPVLAKELSGGPA